MLHDIIQAVMSWENYHLYEFSIGKIILQMPNEDNWGPEFKDSRKVKLSDMLKKEKQNSVTHTTSVMTGNTA